MSVDLHIHSVYSDGKYSPEKICKIASERGLSLISITDHDTLSGLEEKRETAQKYGLNYISGWEISAYLDDEKVHVLGYGCAPNDSYQAFLRRCEEGAVTRMKERIKKLCALGIAVTEEEVYAQRVHENSPIHTMHLARALSLKLGIDDGEVYKRYLGWGKPVYSNAGRPTPKEAIECIHACGGVAVVAHPGRISLAFSERENLLMELADFGVDGIEAVYSTHTEKETEYFTQLAKKKGLFITGGSDTHVEDETHCIGSPKFIPDEKLLLRLGM